MLLGSYIDIFRTRKASNIKEVHVALLPLTYIEAPIGVGVHHRRGLSFNAEHTSEAARLLFQSGVAGTGSPLLEFLPKWRVLDRPMIRLGL